MCCFLCGEGLALIWHDCYGFQEITDGLHILGLAAFFLAFFLALLDFVFLYFLRICIGLLERYELIGWAVLAGYVRELGEVHL